MLTGSVIRFRRHDAVCLGEIHGVSYVCRVIATTETTWHRADVPLSMVECADAGLRPDARIRCWPKAATGGVVVGRLSGTTMARVIAAVKREAQMRAFEDGWGLRDGRTER
ncbi:hypothetical protein [Acetobacter senegalensis]|uniref:hypothetical protein n=1 Tax=Acetobacter senegalensis TaxID=446692 RepID=UPI000AD6F52A|nr:hypothetical protein [Acetobacter senegalensis]